MNFPITYQNGNTNVTIQRDGTKTRDYNDNPKPVHPESIDVKVTNYCDMGCLYCHESSTTVGKHGDLEQLLEVLSPLPAGIELAIGGGNPLSHPQLVPFLQECKKRGYIPNLTINQGHLKPYQELLQRLIKEELIYGIGISVVHNNFKYIKPLLQLSDNIVYHLIAGVNSIDIIDKLIEIGYCKVLVLGYKMFGFGVDYFTDEVNSNLKNWYKHLRSYIGKCTLSFDNLAIEQLKVQRLFTKQGWDKFYMGDDFTFTMYIDAVNQQFAPTSRSLDRVSFDDTNLLNYFQNNRFQ